MSSLTMAHEAVAAAFASIPSGLPNWWLGPNTPAIAYDWLSQPSEVSWCESKYVYTDQIAEFWNTVSALPYLLLALYGLRRASSWLERIMWVEVLFVGVGTAVFHGTLMLGGQLLDEISIVLLLMTATAALSRAPVWFSVISHVAAVAAMFAFPPMNCFMLFGVGLSVVVPIVWRVWQQRIPRGISLAMLSLTLAGIACWGLEKSSCGHALPGFGFLGDYLHAVWHLIMVMVIWLLVNTVVEFVEHRNRMSDLPRHFSQLAKVHIV